MVLCGNVWCCVVLRGAGWCRVMQGGIVWCSVVQCGAGWYGVVQCDAVWCSVMECVVCASTHYGVATISRLLKLIGLFCRISSLLQGSFAKETYNLKEPTNRSHPIWICVAIDGFAWLLSVCLSFTMI